MGNPGCQKLPSAPFTHTILCLQPASGMNDRDKWEEEVRFQIFVRLIQNSLSLSLTHTQQQQQQPQQKGYLNELKCLCGT